MNKPDIVVYGRAGVEFNEDGEVYNTAVWSLCEGEKARSDNIKLIFDMNFDPPKLKSAEVIA